MKIAKRVFLFLTVNILVLTTISIVTQLLGVRPYLTAYGIDYEALMVFCLIWGMGGAFISLALSRVMAKWMTGTKVIKPSTSDPHEKWLVQTVHNLSRQAGLSKMPEVGIYPGQELNAFATGPTASRSLVAVSEGLLSRMSAEQIEGVLAHEIAHVKNGDMVTMTLVQGVVNAFVMFFARIIAFVVSQSVREEAAVAVRIGVTIALDILLGFLGLLVVSFFSRKREYRADLGGAQLAGPHKMVAALQALQAQQRYASNEPEQAPSLASLKISGRRGLMQLFSTHPPLEERIARLKMMSVR